MILDVSLINESNIKKLYKLILIILKLKKNEVLEQTVYINLEKNLYYNYIIFLNEYIIHNGSNTFIDICNKYIKNEKMILDDVQYLESNNYFENIENKEHYENVEQNVEQNKQYSENKQCKENNFKEIYEMFLQNKSNYTNNFNIIELENNDDIYNLTYIFYISSLMLNYYKKINVSNQIIIKSNNNIIIENKKHISYFQNEKDEKIAKETKIYNAEKERIQQKQLDYKSLFKHELNELEQQKLYNNNYLSLITSIEIELPKLIKHVRYFLTIFKSKLTKDIKTEQQQKTQNKQQIQQLQNIQNNLQNQLNLINQQIDLYTEKRFKINAEFYTFLKENNIPPNEWNDDLLMNYTHDDRANTAIKYRKIEKEHKNNLQKQTQLQKRITANQQELTQLIQKSSLTQQNNYKNQKINISIQKNEDFNTEKQQQTPGNIQTLNQNLAILKEELKVSINDLKIVSDFSDLENKFDVIRKMVFILKNIDKDDCKLIYNKLLDILEHVQFVKTNLENEIFDLETEIKQYHKKQEELPGLLIEQTERCENRIVISKQRANTYFKEKETKYLSHNTKIIGDIKVLDEKNNFIKKLLDWSDKNILFIINLFYLFPHLIIEKNNKIENHFDIILNYIIKLNSTDYKKLVSDIENFYKLFENNNLVYENVSGSNNILENNLNNGYENNLENIITSQPKLSLNSNEIYNSNLNILSNVKSQLSTLKKLKKT